MIYRFNHSMYYANAEDLAEEVRDLAATASPPLVWFCIDAVAVDDVDYTAAETLRELQAMLEAKGIRLVVVNLQDDVMAELERSRLTGALGPDATFQTVGEVIRSYRADRLARSGTSGRRPSR
jgi:SulP family sulfate permease